MKEKPGRPCCTREGRQARQLVGVMERTQEREGSQGLLGII